MNKAMPAADECDLKNDDLTRVDEMGQTKSEIVSEIKKVIVGQDKEELLNLAREQAKAGTSPTSPPTNRPPPTEPPPETRGPPPTEPPP